MKKPERLKQLQQRMREQVGCTAQRRGRPRLPIDPVDVAILAGLGLSNKEIAARIPCDRKTLRRFASELERARAKQLAIAKLKDFEAAMRGDRGALRRFARRLLCPEPVRSGEVQYMNGTGEKLNNDTFNK